MYVAKISLDSGRISQSIQSGPIPDGEPNAYFDHIGSLIGRSDRGYDEAIRRALAIWPNEPAAKPVVADSVSPLDTFVF